MAKVEYEFMCPVCGEVETIQLEISDEDNLAVEAGVKELKDCVQPGTFEKEVFISGMCYSCQEKTFNRPAPGHEGEWGEVVGECEVCGCPIYKKDMDNGKCPQCSCEMPENLYET